MKINKIVFLLPLVTLFFSACHSQTSKSGSAEADSVVLAPSFNEDSAFVFVQKQCEFGPRTMNSKAHDKCGDYLVATFKKYGATVTEQFADVKAFDGTVLKNRNIIASYNVDNGARILVCSHWDSRPWADADPDEKNHKTPVMGANDGASGVAVMLELARQIQQKNINVGIDFICLDAEDYGTDNDEDSWALGAQYWAANPHVAGYKARYGILLDMVGGQGARFMQEGFSLEYARSVVNKVWNAADEAGYSSVFPRKQGGYITDDHGPINKIANIPTIDIIPYYEGTSCSFGPTWHTINDDVEHIDKSTLKAVGQTMMLVIYNEK